MTIKSLGHINIVVDNIEEASQYYQSLLKASPQQKFPHFKNIGFAKSAGFMSEPENVEVCIEFLKIDQSDIFIELMEYHSPQGNHSVVDKKANTIGGVGHICFRVEDIDSEFHRIKHHPNVTLISLHDDYRPYQISNIKQGEFFFYDEELENDEQEKKSVCDIIGNIKYFYFIDKYGLQWEFEEGHSDIGS